MIAALVGERIGDVLEERRIDPRHEIAEAVRERAPDVAFERHPRADRHRIDGHPGIGADELPALARQLGAAELELERRLGDRIGLPLVGAAQRRHGIVGHAAQGAIIERGRGGADLAVADRHGLSSCVCPRAYAKQKGHSNSPMNYNVGEGG